MNTWTALVLSRQRAGELQCEAARYRLAKLVAASSRPRRTTRLTSRWSRASTHGSPVRLERG
jgi:hypothetical protein